MEIAKALDTVLGDTDADPDFLEYITEAVAGLVTEDADEETWKETILPYLQALVVD